MSIISATAFLTLALQSAIQPPPDIQPHVYQFSASQNASSVLNLSEADLNTIVPGLTGSPSGVASYPPPPVQVIQPSYESWDVLRQYPRYSPPSQPSAPAAKPQDTQKNAKENKDA